MKKLYEMDFDVSDTPREPTPQKKKGPPSAVPVKRDPAAANRGHAYNPGMPPERRKTEGPEDSNPMGQPQARRRASSATVQVTPVQQPRQTQPSPNGKFDVSLPDGRVVRIPAGSAQDAQKTAGEWLKNNPAKQKGAPGMYATMDDDDRATPDQPQGASVDWQRFKVQPSPNEGATAADAGPGPQLDREGLARLREMVNSRIKEIVRKKQGGGGYNLYAPNKGKKKNPKPVGEFPTRMAAKRAELARFPPKDPEALKKARKRLDKLSKDPKKRIEKEKEEMKSKGSHRSGRPARDRKAKKEAIVNSIANALVERLFREEEIAGSPWDDRISGLHPDALSQDKKLSKFHKDMHVASQGALGDGHKALTKALRGVAKVQPGDIMHDEDRGKMYMPVTLDVDGTEIGPVHLYVDGGHVCIEVSKDAREAIGGLEPNMAKDLRGGLMSFQEDHLPKIDKAKKAWNERDSYLDKLHQKLEKSVGGMSPVEVHLAKQLMNKRRR